MFCIQRFGFRLGTPYLLLRPGHLLDVNCHPLPPGRPGCAPKLVRFPKWRTCMRVYPVCELTAHRSVRNSFRQLARMSALITILITIGAFLLPGSAQAQVNLVTYHNDNARTGVNANETVLTPSNVNKNNFGKLFTQGVDGIVVGQPLYLANISANVNTNGILWVINGTNMQAYGAGTLKLLYTTKDAGTRDTLPTTAHFATQTVANGKVYVATRQNLVVYGLFPALLTVAGNNQTAIVNTVLPVVLRIKAVDPYSGQPFSWVTGTSRAGG